MSIKIVKGDITELNVDCIVNAANEHLIRGGGVCGAIFRKAGYDLDKECAELGGCETGSAKMTSGCNLPVKYICHAVGPIYSETPEDEKLLSGAYSTSLDLALAYNCNSIAFPCISTGIFGYPLEEACNVAYNTVLNWLKSHNDALEVILCCFDNASYDIYNKLLKKGL